ncbi:MAG: hypothetical protein IKO47_00775 [Ruminococcus sp.]|nr:hypothetical protein [Ruminococcus sp.]
MAKSKNSNRKNVPTPSKKNTGSTRTTKMRIIMLILALIMALGLLLPLFL